MTESENRRCAVVTGSTRGIGRAVARELAAAGMNVVVNSSSERSLPAAEAVAVEIADLSTLTFDTDTWQTLTKPLDKRIKGKHDIYLVFGNGKFLFDEWKFTK